MDDNLLEIDEMFKLTINSSSLPNRVIVNNPSESTVAIIDNDRKLLILFKILYYYDLSLQLLLSASASRHTVLMKIVE